MIYTTIYRCLRASTLVVLNKNIAIFIITKYQNVPYNGRAKAIFFGSTATMFFYLCIHTAFNYFSHFYSFFYFYFYSFVFTLILFVRSHFFYSYFFFFFYFSFFIQQCEHYILFVCSHCYCSFILIFFFFSYILFFFLFTLLLQ